MRYEVESYVDPSTALMTHSLIKLEEKDGLRQIIWQGTGAPGEERALLLMHDLEYRQDNMPLLFEEIASEAGAVLFELRFEYGNRYTAFYAREGNGNSFIMQSYRIGALPWFSNQELVEHYVKNLKWRLKQQEKPPQLPPPDTIVYEPRT